MTEPADVDNADPAADAVVVRLGSGRYAIELEHVAEVGKAPAVTRVPGMPDWLAGVANFRGRILPVLDLRGMLGADQGTAGSSARLVVVATEMATAGLLVDGVDGTTSLATGIEPIPVTIAAGRADLIRGQLPRADGPLAVLDVPAVIALRDRIPRA